jgi:raffinose/stachyose/melibiose transport system substrate-binding protein
VGRQRCYDFRGTVPEIGIRDLSASGFSPGQKGVQRMKRAIVVVVLATLCLAPLMAAGQDEASEEPETKTLRFLASWAESDENSKVILDLTDEYIAQNPNVQMEFEAVSSDDLKRQVNIYIASGDAPDVFCYDSGQTLLDLINADKVVNIEEEFTRLGIMDVLDEGAVSLLQTLVGGAGLYAIPMGWNLEGIWYNIDLFEQYDQEVPETWDELVAVAEAFDSVGIQPFAAAGKEKWPITRYLNMYVMRRMGVDGMRRASNGEISYTDPGFIESAAAVQELANAGYFGSSVNTVDYSTAQSMFLTAQTAMIYNGSWMVGTLNDPEQNLLGESVGFFNIPVVEGGPGDLGDYSVNAGTILALSSDKYDDATADWVEYVFTRLGNRAMADYGTLKGFRVTEMPTELPYYTRMLRDEFTNVQRAGLWFEATLDARTESIAKDNAQLLFIGEMTPVEYFQAIGDSTADFLSTN